MGVLSGLDRQPHAIEVHHRGIAREEGAHHRQRPVHQGGLERRRTVWHPRRQLRVAERPPLAMRMKARGQVRGVEAARKRGGAAGWGRQLGAVECEEGAASRHVDDRPDLYPAINGAPRPTAHPRVADRARHGLDGVRVLVVVVAGRGQVRLAHALRLGADVDEVAGRVVPRVDAQRHVRVGSEMRHEVGHGPRQRLDLLAKVGLGRLGRLRLSLGCSGGVGARDRHLHESPTHRRRLSGGGGHRGARAADDHADSILPRQRVERRHGRRRVAHLCRPLRVERLGSRGRAGRHG
eukprot:scaffold57191_cov64-Phaeocystis_antarctica.AAC.3